MTRGVIEKVALLDLSSMRSADELSEITEIRDVALLLVRESLVKAVTAIPMRNVAQLLPVPDDGTANVTTGSLVMPGSGLAGPGSEGIALVVVGSLVLTSPVERVTYDKLMVTGSLLAPRGSEAALAAGLTRMTGSIQYFDYAEGQRIHTLTGDAQIGGDTLANRGGTLEDILLVAGDTVITGAPAEVGYQRVILAGDALAPREAEALLAPVITVAGDLAWYAGRPRIIGGKETLSAGFFELLAEPAALALHGKITIAGDVTPELLREKITDITLLGKLVAPAALVPSLQLLTTTKVGKIMAYGDAGDDE